MPGEGSKKGCGRETGQGGARGRWAGGGPPPGKSQRRVRGREEVTVMARGRETECRPDCQTDGKEIARARGRMGVEGPGRDGDRQKAGDESKIGRVIT